MARETYITQCMEQKGYPYTPVLPVKVDETVNIDHLLRQKEPNIDYANSLKQSEREAYYMALNGVPDPNDPGGPGGGGCMGEAFDTIPGVYAMRSELGVQYRRMQRSVKQDSEVQEAEQRWSTCMQQHGYHYENTTDLAAAPDNAILENQYTKTFEEEHREAMKIGRECGNQTGLDNTIAKVRLKKEAEFVAAHPLQLDQHIVQLQEQTVLVEQLLQDSTQ